ncbi:MAG: flavin reductase [Clostridiaceae bacterium]|nr:flavin reductase [Clostridiaceae bacterium]
MHIFSKIDPKEISGNVISLFDDGWALLTAGSKDDFNTMTISWGQMGCLWNRPVCTVYVRPSRYTYEYTEANGCFTVSLFDKADCRSQLKVLGSRSGRDMDKMHSNGLTPFELDGCMAFQEARTVLVLKKLYRQQLDANLVPENILGVNYAGANPDQLHFQYICEITAAYTKKDD